MVANQGIEPCTPAYGAGMYPLHRIAIRLHVCIFAPIVNTKMVATLAGAPPAFMNLGAIHLRDHPALTRYA